MSIVSNPDAVGEKHHILPKSIFPEYNKAAWNLVVLSVENHFKAHVLLPSIVIDKKHWHKMVCALHMMLKHKPKGYDYAKHRELMVFANTGENNPNFGKRGELSKNFGKPLSEHRKKNISESLIGTKHPMYGVAKTEAFKINLSIKHTGKVFTQEHRKNISLSKSHQNHPMWGKHKTAETKQKIAEAVSGTNNGGYGKTLGKNPNARAVLYEGVIYTSALLASLELGIHKSTVTKWGKLGKMAMLPKNWEDITEYKQYIVISDTTKKEF